MRKVIGLVALGALAKHYLDPQLGRTRRARLGQRVPAFFRQRGNDAGRLGRGVAAGAYGLKQKATHLREEEKDLNDPTLKAKVESEIFRDAHVPKGHVNVLARDGVVELRGEVQEPELIEELVARARSVEGVREVENLLHLPGTEAPTHR